MLRPTAGESSSSVTQSMSSPPTTASMSSTIAGRKYAPDEHRTHRARLRVGQRQRRARLATAARQHVDVAPAGVVHDDDDRPALDRFELVARTDAGEELLDDVGLQQTAIRLGRQRLPSSGYGLLAGLLDRRRRLHPGRVTCQSAASSWSRVSCTSPASTPARRNEKIQTSPASSTSLRAVFVARQRAAEQQPAGVSDRNAGRRRRRSRVSLTIVTWSTESGVSIATEATRTNARPAIAADDQQRDERCARARSSRSRAQVGGRHATLQSFDRARTRGTVRTSRAAAAEEAEPFRGARRPVAVDRAARSDATDVIRRDAGSARADRRYASSAMPIAAAKPLPIASATGRVDGTDGSWSRGMPMVGARKRLDARHRHGSGRGHHAATGRSHGRFALGRHADTQREQGRERADEARSEDSSGEDAPASRSDSPHRARVADQDRGPASADPTEGAQAIRGRGVSRSTPAPGRSCRPGRTWRR